MMQTVGEIIPYFKKRLKLRANEREIVSWAYMVISDVLGYSRSLSILQNQESIKENDKRKIIDFVEQLESNIPIQYVLGVCDFFGLKFNLDKNVLIPRPETQELVKWVLEEKFDSVLDIGTGSGCIAITLGNYTNAKITAIDISLDAIMIAKKNAIINNVEVNFLEKDILKSELNKKFDLIVSNPPYILNSYKNKIDSRILNNEPHLALFVPDDNPLLFYKRIVELSSHSLNKGGKIFFEINEEYGELIKELLISKGFVDIELKKDINEKDRMVKAIWK